MENSDAVVETRNLMREELKKAKQESLAALKRVNDLEITVRFLDKMIEEG